MTEAELTSIANFFQFPLGRLTYTADNVIAMEISENHGKIVGFSSILNYIHNKLCKTDDIAEHYLSKQFFDFSNLFLRFTCKKDKCKEK